MDIAQEILTTFNDNPDLLKNIIPGYESFVYGYDNETNAQSYHPEEPRSKKARQIRANVKVLLTVFFDCNGITHCEFLPQGRTVNREYYLEVLRRLPEQFVRNAQNCGKTQSMDFAS